MPKRKYNIPIGSRAKLDMIGKRFGHLVCLRMADRLDHKSRLLWWFLCDCGTECEKSGISVRYGDTVSCGCFHRQQINSLGKVTHGRSKTSLYKAWNSMNQRCHNPNVDEYKYYGARGISVCDRWRFSFTAFLADMGERPKGLSIDRINNDGNYEPGNCRWATIHQQAMNKRPRQHRCDCGTCRLCRDRIKHQTARDAKVAACA